MRSLRSWFVRETSPGAVVQDAPATEILGVTDDPRHDVASGGTGLYEFRTAGGVPVYLHDTTLTSLEWQPVLRRLVVRFAYDDPQWTPAEAVDTPVVVMAFDDVVIREWRQDHEDEESAPANVAGQVSDFSYDGGDSFGLVTYQSEISFRAKRLTVSVEPVR
ncbi:hypothetical protein [Kribbella sp. CA-294648]|uniref:hypothetical protein n=1 Tax=Kribbella sp. CA-294648 TaxID=3239948 RepID=UPI003D9212D5